MFLCSALAAGVIECEAGGEPHQVHFGVLLHNALVVLWVIPVPPVSLPIIVQPQIRLSVFVRRDARTCEFGPHLSGPLLLGNEKYQYEGHPVLFIIMNVLL